MMPLINQGSGCPRPVRCPPCNLLSWCYGGLYVSMVATLGQGEGETDLEGQEMGGGGTGQAPPPPWPMHLNPLAVLRAETQR